MKQRMGQRTGQHHTPSLALSRILIVAALREPVLLWLLQRWAGRRARLSNKRLH